MENEYVGTSTAAREVGITCDWMRRLVKTNEVESKLDHNGRHLIKVSSLKQWQARRRPAYEHLKDWRANQKSLAVK